MNILLSWLGNTDLNAAMGKLEDGDMGPIYPAIICKKHKFDSVWLLSNYTSSEEAIFKSWIEDVTEKEVQIEHVEMPDPTNFERIFNFARLVIKKALKRCGEDSNLTYHLSPGTPAMAAIWIILAKTSIPKANLVKSSKSHNPLDDVIFPFNLFADYTPEQHHESDKNISNYIERTSINLEDFKEILHRSEIMQSVIDKAIRHSRHTYSVLILGETGTGKELIAQAIHNASKKHLKRNGQCIAVNCGAIAENLVESELFGCIKGAYTGAVAPRPGHIQSADGGTLFLDEIGELPLSAQVKLLRVLQERKVTKVGDQKAVSVNFRLVCATHRNLVEEVKAGRFREDLFHRIAVGLITLPPLRDRPDDIIILADHFLSKIKDIYILRNKELSANARNYLKQQKWPGNIRELESTLIRASLTSSNNVINEDDLKEALFDFSQETTDNILNRPLGNGFKAEDLIKDIKKHYAQRAWDESDGAITKAGKELLGLNSFQTLYKWHPNLWGKKTP